ncbi:hypothetical protein ACFSQ3_08650 [Sphingobacterium corticis]|uniref:Uncharacterized protein n=1 Tax=Sphingobacterium corticis TaxID=1812823 RepID=A0ABW5NJY6_9SPHI
MKKITAIFIISSLIGCKTDYLPENTDSHISNISANANNTLNTYYSTDFDWSTSSILLKNNNGVPTEVPLPWIGGVPSTIPTRILEDMSKANGWELYYNFPDWNLSVYNQNYLIFHNRFTGVLRVFTYNFDHSINNSEGLFNVQIEGIKSTSLLAMKDPLIGDFKTSNPNIIISNDSDGDLSGFRVGWNSFDIPLVYDGDISSSDKLKISIHSDQKQLSTIAMTGTFSSTTKGTLTTTSSSNPLSSLINASIKQGGTKAKEFLENKISGDTIKGKSGILPLLISNSVNLVSNLATSGITGIFSSFIGKFGSTSSSSQSINLNTEGKITSSGTILTGIPGIIVSAKNFALPGTNYIDGGILPSQGGLLGSWTLKQRPVVSYGKFARGTRDDLIQSYTIDNSSIEVVLNSKTAEAISDYTVTTELWYYDKYMGVNKPTFNNSNTGGTEPYIYGIKKVSNSNEHAGELIYKDDQNEFYRNARGVYVQNMDWIEFRDASRKNVPMNNYDPSFIVKVTLVLYPKSPYNTDPIVMTRTYLPLYK